MVLITPAAQLLSEVPHRGTRADKKTRDGDSAQLWWGAVASAPGHALFALRLPAVIDDHGVLHMFDRSVRPVLRRYSVAVLASALAFALAWLIRPWIELNVFPLLLGAVAVSTWFAGFGPGLLATVVGAFLSDYFFLPPAYSLAFGSANGLLQWGVFVLVALLISSLAALRERAEEHERQQHEWFRVTLSSISDAVIATDTTGRVTFMNRVAEALTGWKQEETIGERLEAVQRVADEQTRNQLASLVTRVLQGGAVVGLGDPAVLIARDGTERLVEESAAPIRDGQGKTIGVILVFRDVSERQRAEKALHESEERFRVAQEVSLDAFTILRSVRDDRGAIVDFEWEYVNPIAAQVLRSSVEGLVGQRLLQLLPGNKPSGLFDSYVKVVGTGVSHDIEIRYKAEGIDGWFRNMAVRLGDGVAISFHDISGRKRAEEAQRLLIEASRILAASLDYETTLQSVARLALPVLADVCAVDILDADGVLRRVAVAAADPVKDALARDLQRCYPPDPKSVADRRVIQSGKSEIVSEIPDSFWETASQDPAHLTLLRALGVESFMIVPLVASGRALGAITFMAAESGRCYGSRELALAEDLAHRAALAVDNARLYQEAQAAVEARDALLSIASHEVKTPLATVQGYAELLLRRATREGPTNEADRHALQSIYEQTVRLSRLIDSLLDLSHLQNSPRRIEREAVDLCALARRLVETLQPALERHTVELLAPPEALLVAGDELRLEQVLQNLLQNAIKYSPQGGAVTVGLERQGEHIALTVSDRGIGIPSKDLERIFSRFYRASTATARSISGAGLGLAVAKEIVTLHGGTIEVSSREGEGSTFTVSLPALLISEENEGQRQGAALALNQETVGS